MEGFKGGKILEDFEVQKLLGKGSYGTVYRVRRKSDSQIYALKEADVQRMSPAERMDAVNEIRLLASVQHPNIVKYHEAFLEDNKLCIIMEYAPNGDLSRFIKKGTELNKAFPEEILWRYLFQIAQGLQQLHSRHILHRDIKPANIFVGERDIVKLGDLGIAKLIKDGAARTQIGTPHYMAPELWMNRPYAYSSDMWALGCLVYELATYSTPFAAKNIAELRAKVLAGRFKPVLPGRYTEDLICVINGLLQLNPAKRLDMAKLMTLPRMATLASAARRAHEDKGQCSDQDLLKTIKIPADIRLLSERLPPPCYGNPGDRAPGDGVSGITDQLARQSFEKQHGVAPPAKARDPPGQLRPSQPHVSLAGGPHEGRSHHSKVPSAPVVRREGGSHVHHVPAVAAAMRK